MFKPDALKLIKDSVSIYDVLGCYNLSTNRSGFVVCPFHAEKTASMKIYGKTNTYKCFGCGAFGDVIDFVAKMETATVRDAMEILAARFGLDVFITESTSPEVIKKAQEAQAARDLEKAKSVKREEYIRTQLSLIAEARKTNEINMEFVDKNVSCLGEDFALQLLADYWEKGVWLEYLYDTLAGRFCPNNRYRYLLSLDRVTLARKLYTNELSLEEIPFKKTKEVEK